MFTHRFDDQLEGKIVVHWLLLSFNAGCINAGGFLASGQFVTHVTGFATLFGVDLANNKLSAAIGILSVPIFFLAGAFIAGHLIDGRTQKHKKPHIDYVMSLSASCLLLAALIGDKDYFGNFGINFSLGEGYFLLALLCLASGLQNGAITSSSGSSVRTTHLTGLTTDLGIGLARILNSRKSLNLITDRETFSNWLRILTIASFVFGSAAGAGLFNFMKYKGFIVPALISTYVAWHGRKLKTAPHKDNQLV